MTRHYHVPTFRATHFLLTLAIACFATASLAKADHVYFEEFAPDGRRKSTSSDDVDVVRQQLLETAVRQRQESARLKRGRAQLEKESRALDRELAQLQDRKDYYDELQQMVYKAERKLRSFRLSAYDLCPNGHSYSRCNHTTRKSIYNKIVHNEREWYRDTTKAVQSAKRALAEWRQDVDAYTDKNRMFNRKNDAHNQRVAQWKSRQSELTAKQKRYNAKIDWGTERIRVFKGDGSWYEYRYNVKNGNRPSRPYAD